MKPHQTTSPVQRFSRNAPTRPLTGSTLQCDVRAIAAAMSNAPARIAAAFNGAPQPYIALSSDVCSARNACILWISPALRAASSCSSSRAMFTAKYVGLIIRSFSRISTDILPVPRAKHGRRQVTLGERCAGADRPARGTAHKNWTHRQASWSHGEAIPQSVSARIGQRRAAIGLQTQRRQAGFFLTGFRRFPAWSLMAFIAVRSDR